MLFAVDPFVEVFAELDLTDLTIPISTYEAEVLPMIEDLPELYGIISSEYFW